jgi:hypothetical protein
VEELNKTIEVLQKRNQILEIELRKVDMRENPLY